MKKCIGKEEVPRIFRNFSKYFLAGGRCHPDPPSLKRSFVIFDRGGQTRPPRSNDFLFGAADDTSAADDRPANIACDLASLL